MFLVDNMKVVIRTDATNQIGTGHFMRCLTLAEGLKKQAAHICFISRNLPAYLREMLTTKDMEFILLDGNANGTDELNHSHWLGSSQAQDAQATVQVMSDQVWDWLIVDHYALDNRWESVLRQSVKKIFVIDDLADRQHDCDLLLDQNYYADMETRYIGKVPRNCQLLLGQRYALLREEFADTYKHLRVRNGQVRRIMVFFGGSDVTNQTQKTLDAIKILAKQDIMVDIVVGASNPHKEKVKQQCNDMPNVQYHCQVSNMAELMNCSDLAIGAGGATTWERCVLGLPSLTLVFADNQLQTTADLAEFGAIQFLGWAHEVSVVMLTQSIRDCIERPELLHKLSEKASSLMKDWLGTESVVNTMKDLLENIG